MKNSETNQKLMANRRNNRRSLQHLKLRNPVEHMFSVSIELCIWNLYLQLQSTQTKTVNFDHLTVDIVGPACDKALQET